MKVFWEKQVRTEKKNEIKAPNGNVSYKGVQFGYSKLFRIVVAGHSNMLW